MNIILLLFNLLIILFIVNKSGFEYMDNKLYKIAYELGVNYLNTVERGLINPAVMFDIDDTLLYVTPDKINSFKPIKQIIRLLNECRKRGILVLIITARSDKFTTETIRDLKKYKIEYDFLYLRNSPKDDTNTFKSNVKKKLFEQNKITTIMSVGDNEIDILGKYSGDYSIKLPNKTDPKLYQLSYGKLENIVP